MCLKALRMGNWLQQKIWDEKNDKPQIEYLLKSLFAVYSAKNLNKTRLLPDWNFISQIYHKIINNIIIIKRKEEIKCWNHESIFLLELCFS